MVSNEFAAESSLLGRIWALIRSRVVERIALLNSLEPLYLFRAFVGKESVYVSA
jgi:hypothetical protein